MNIIPVTIKKRFSDIFYGFQLLTVFFANQNNSKQTQNEANLLKEPSTRGKRYYVQIVTLFGPNKIKINKNNYITLSCLQIDFLFIKWTTLHICLFVGKRAGSFLLSH